MMDGVDLPNDSGNVGKWRIWMPDGSIRMVQMCIRDSIQSQLEFKSAGADLNVKSVRIYNKALTSDEVLQ